MDESPKIKSYQQNLQKRIKEAQAKKAQGGRGLNFAQAQSEFDPKRDGAMTLDQLAEAQRAESQRDQPPEQRPMFSKETLGGMQALADAQRKAAPAQPMKTAALTEEPSPVAPQALAEEPGDEESEAGEDDETEGALVDFFRTMNKQEEDPINNERNRKAIEANLREIDVSAGILTGVFEQEVPVIPQLTVVFRTLTAFEDQALRLHLYKKLEKDRELERISGNLLSLYQTVASVAQLGGEKQESHWQVSRDGLPPAFLGDVFDRKVNRYLMYPLPIIGAIGLNSAWFEMRVRRLLSHPDTLKNG